ncbi:bifunctional phosphoglucose/phosphomannose isomerase [Limnochorda sp.]|uniref:bifunctional phosphoglucose/phosphomannose isomerase n=1 Tax=Limnochorda sp. TaxID=1940279 RepID=UPI001841C81E|nr:bifunctional phosphoglucose/phosphomannose isomerase [Bacillota bacterium]MBO2519694.1 bifunctional phosphoglucose/phosphomannose isomerase [Bacillota bacterium]NMA72271.1 bifunctional phosphoglucose/phosphomannose isomerase [Bacillota bacterium]
MEANADRAQGAALLDDRQACQALDPSDMAGAIHGLPEQCEEAWRGAQSADLPPWERPRQVVVLGMGGSAIGAELVAGLLEGSAPVPIAVHRGYGVPGYVGPETLVIASSYSGNTEETLSGYDAAKSRGAQLVAVTTGGALAERAERDGVPWVRIPSGLQPRAAIGHSLVPQLAILHRAGLMENPEPSVQEAIRVLKGLRERLEPAVPAAQNEAKQIALDFHQRLPVIYGTQGWKGVVAYRWKTQINENAKAQAMANQFPELNHNETVGWEVPPAINRLCQVVLLREPDDPALIRRRIEVTAELMRPHVAGIREVWAEGDSALARLFSLLYLGDYVSLYLAYLYRVDPTPVKAIDRLKRELARLQAEGGERGGDGSGS